MKQTRKTKEQSSHMSLKIDIPQPDILKPKITIFGVGGAGGNAINNMIRANLEGVEFIAANTDSQALQNSLAEHKIQLGVKTTRGLGAGSFPDRGRASAEENVEEIERYLEGSNMVFIAAGMGGGTGTGAAPVIAQLARDKGILTVGVVTKPFHFEGKYRMESAESGIEELKKYVDTLIVIPNQNLFRIANEHTTFESAFKMADDVLHAGVRGVTDLITMPGLVNLDFADIRTIMTQMGKAMMGTGEATGENRAIVACEAAISNPLLDDISIKGAKGVLVNMTGGPDMTLFEADMAVNAIRKEVDGNANIIFGSAFNENMKGKIRISVVATGIDEEEFRKSTIFKNETRQEPTRFRANITSEYKPSSPISKSNKESSFVEEKNIEERKSATQSFFDPGIAIRPDFTQIEEISGDTFKSKQDYLKEENPNYDNNFDNNKVDDILKFSEEKHNQEEQPKQTNFFQEKEMVSFKMPSENVEERKVNKPVKSTQEKKKEKSFSLFSFMNGNKSKEENLPNKEEAMDNSTSEYIDLDDHQFNQKNNKQDIENKEKEAQKKRNEFFASTIFEEDDNVVENSPMFDSDVLSVPAFLRRNKNK